MPTDLQNATYNQRNSAPFWWNCSDIFSKTEANVIQDSVFARLLSLGFPNYLYLLDAHSSPLFTSCLHLFAYISQIIL
jgi:hypothetical protein